MNTCRNCGQPLLYRGPCPCLQDAAEFGDDVVHTKESSTPTLQAQIDALKTQVDQLASLVMLQAQAITALQRKTGGKE